MRIAHYVLSTVIFTVLMLGVHYVAASIAYAMPVWLAAWVAVIMIGGSIAGLIYLKVTGRLR